MTQVEEQIYRRPRDYDLEHENDDEDVVFHVELARRLAPRRVLELGAGSGRITLPLAEEAARSGFTVIALDVSQPMLEEAERKLAAATADVRRCVTLVAGDMRTWEAAEPFDLIVVPCGSVTHLLTLDDQLATWSRAHDNLVAGGRFVVDVPMPDLTAYAESLRRPRRALVEIDSDTADAEGRRLVRYKTTEYAPHEQRASIRPGASPGTTSGLALQPDAAWKGRAGFPSIPQRWPTCRAWRRDRSLPGCC